MTVTHDFTLLASWDTTDGWSGSNDVTPTAVSEPRLEGSGAVSIVKGGTSEQWFYAEYSFPSPVDLSNKVLVFYLYVSSDYITKLDALRIRVYDTANNYYEYNLDVYLKSGRWQPIVMGCYTALSGGLHWDSIAKLRIIFHTPSSSNTFPQGAIVVDRLLAGTGFYVLYSSAENPDTMEDVALADERDNLMLVERVTRHLYVIRAPIYVGDGEHTGALYIKNAVVVGDPVGLYYGFSSLIMVNTGSWFKHEGGMLVDAARDVYPYGVQMLNSRDAELYLERLYVIDARAQYVGVSSRTGLSGTVTLSDVFFNTEVWMPKNVTYQGLLAILPHGYLIYNFLGELELDIPIYVFKNATLKSREGTVLTVTNLVVAEGSFVAEHATAVAVNPVNMTRDNIAATSYSASAKAYYDVDIYLVDRYGNPLEGVDVRIYDKDSNLVAEATTDDQGHVSFRLLVFEKATDNSGNLVTDEDYNPFTLEAYVGSGLVAKTRLLVYERKTYYITPDNVYVMVTWPEKARISINEPEHIIVKVHKVDGTPVSGLDVYADVEDPQHNVITLVLSEDPQNPGTYTGEYLFTDKVGTYNYRAYTTIENTMIEAHNSFDVGLIEANLNEIKELIKKHDAKLDAYKWMG